MDLKAEVSSKDHQLTNLEQRCKRSAKEEQELKDREHHIAAELETLREKLRCKDEERQESAQREERMQRQC